MTFTFIFLIYFTKKGAIFYENVTGNVTGNVLIEKEIYKNNLIFNPLHSSKLRHWGSGVEKGIGRIQKSNKRRF
jgi:hypothetical protein